MATEWICYLDNQEFGPVSEPDLMELIREGTVPVNTYIRRPTDTEWTTVEKVFGPNVLKRQELAPHAAVNSTAESRVFTDSPTLVNLPSHGGNDWYWHVAGETFGPGGFDILSELCMQGLVGSDDFVRIGLSGEWMKAGTIAELFPAAPSFVDAPGLTSPPPAPPPGVISAPSANLEDHSARMLADETKLLQQLLDLLQKNPSLTQLARPTSNIPVDQQWYCLVSGHEVGPLSIETLVQMVLQGRVFPGDVIRLGTTGEWFPASSVEGLFPKASPGSAAPLAQENVASPLPEKASEKPGNIRRTPESDLVIQGLERLYKASEAAAAELAEKEMKEGKPVEKNKVVGSSTNPSASRQAADSIIKNYSQFAISSAEKKKAEELANRVPLSVQIKQNWKQIVIVAVAVIALGSLVVFISTSLAP